MDESRTNIREGSHGRRQQMDAWALPLGAQYAIPFVRSKRVLKLSESTDVVIVGTCATPTGELRRLLESFHQKRVSFTSIAPELVTTYLARADLAEPTILDTVAEKRVRLDQAANEAPIVNLVNGLLLQALHVGASDIHLESGREKARVRLRVDGRLSTIETFAPNLFPPLSTRIKLIAGLNIMERRLPQDGRVTVGVGEETADLRVSSVPMNGGESIVVRLFPIEHRRMSLDELGFLRCDIAILQGVAHRPSGLILATGPTGSGKSTTLTALLRLIASESKKIVTIEDPVEQLLAGSVQLQTDERIGLSFDRLLRHVLRQDPNVVMVGEVRDSATCELAVRASLTGHLILSTLHTNSAVAAVARLRNLGAPAYLVAEVLQAALAQRLVRRLCPQCKKSSGLTKESARLLEVHHLEAHRVASPVGCSSCRGTGYDGRIPLLELFIPDDTAREMIASGVPLSHIVARESARGSRSLLRDGLEKVAEGLTSFDELRSAVEVP